MPYDPSWVDQAFAELYRTQCGLQIDLLASARLSDKEQDAAFLCHATPQALREPVKLVLDQLFRVNVYSESNLLRGLYLCGDATIASAMVRQNPEEEGQKNPSLSMICLAKTVPREWSGASPKAWSFDQGRALRLAKAGLAASIVVSILLLWSAYANLPKMSAR